MEVEVFRQLLDGGALVAFVAFLAWLAKVLINLLRMEQTENQQMDVERSKAASANQDALLVIVELLKDTVTDNTSAINNSNKTMEAVVSLIQNLERLLQDIELKRAAEADESEERIKGYITEAARRIESKAEERWKWEDELWRKITDEHKLGEG